MNSAVRRLRGAGIAACIAIIASAMQAVRLPPVLDGPALGIALGKAPNPHLLTGFLDRVIDGQCHLAAPCIQHWNAGVFALVIFLIGTIAAERAFGLLATAILAISPLAVAGVIDPLGASASIGLLLATVAAIDVVGARAFHVAVRGALALALALVDPTLLPFALLYGAFGGAIPFACAAVGTAIRLLIQLPALDPLAAPATLVAFGAILFVGGPLLMLAVRHGAFRELEGEGHALLRTGALAGAAIIGGLFAGSGDVASAWLVAEAALLTGIVVTVRARPGTKLFERMTIAAGALFVVQFLLFVQHHRDVTTAAITYRGDDLRGMIAGAPAKTCVASDPTARRYVLASGDFLSVYPPKRPPLLVPDVAQCLSLPASTTIVTIAGLAVNNWGLAVPLMQAYEDASNPIGVLQIEGGAVTPHMKAPTPTGRGAFGNDIETPRGRVGDFTILSGYTYAPSCVRIASGAHLTFAATSIPGTPELPLTIAATSGGASKQIASLTFPASPANQPNRWLGYSIPVATSNCATLSFALGGAGTVRRWLTIAGAIVR